MGETKNTEELSSRLSLKLNNQLSKVNNGSNKEYDIENKKEFDIDKDFNNNNMNMNTKTKSITMNIFNKKQSISTSKYNF